ncbi:hypothetical protein ACIA5H_05695 [Nocardia sp. NPDC051900]|uniref:hypothetical protein n=1 Tax=Nocardia sp. NPDC051900 TaxID=3364326 RepID=UPI003795D834
MSYRGNAWPEAGSKPSPLAEPDAHKVFINWEPRVVSRNRAAVFAARNRRAALARIPRVNGLAAENGIIQLADLLRGRHVDIDVAYRALQLIRFLFTPNTVYASIAPEDGGLVFFWTALDMSIEIDIIPGDKYWWSVRNVAAESYSGEGEVLPFRKLQYSLNHLSKEVEVANPKWRRAVR